MSQKKISKLHGVNPPKFLPGLINNKDMKAFTRAARESEHKTLAAWVHRTLRDAAEKQ